MHLQLMGFVAVTGILAAIVVPAYNDYAARSRAKDASAVAARAMQAVARTFEAKGPSDMSSSEITGWTPLPATRSMQRLAIARDGAITLYFTDRVASADRAQLQIVPVSGGKRLDLSDPANRGRAFAWQCGGPLGTTTLEAVLRPDDCRG